MAEMPNRFSNEYKIISFEKVNEERDAAVRVILKIYKFDFESESDREKIKKMIENLADEIFIRELYILKK